jgi:alpha-ketoglutarate-dependent taurine dioxygenase
VFSASELPGYYPIPQHCEMTFTAQPPRRIFFWCGTAPKSPGGETPLVDFSRVWGDLDAGVRERFQQRGIRIVRNYSGPDSATRDLFQLKRWHEMFRTTDKAVVEKMARAEGFEPQWHAHDRLTLISRHRPMRLHPDGGQPVWFNHTQVFHLSTAPAEFRRIFRYRPSLRSLGLWIFSSLLVRWKRLRLGPDEQAMHVTYDDGSEIPAADLERLRDAIWSNLVVYAWRKGDVVALDNNRIGHGRLPYQGPRMVAVCWA